MKWKIIADSGCDYRSLDNLAPDTEFVSVPLTIQVGETIYTDDVQPFENGTVILVVRSHQRQRSTNPIVFLYKDTLNAESSIF